MYTVVKKTFGKRSNRKSQKREDNITTNRRETSFEDGRWMEVANGSCLMGGLGIRGVES
jgi:hypothetical protein